MSARTGISKVLSCLAASILAVLLLCLAACKGAERSHGDASVQQQVGASFEVTMSGQTLGLESVENARELGGYPTEDGRRVRHGRLLRSASLQGLSNRDAKRLRERFGLSVIADLRTSLEADESPDPVLDGVNYIDLHVVEDSTIQRRVAALADTFGDDGPYDEAEWACWMVDRGYVDEQSYVVLLSSATGKAGYRRLFDELISLPEDRSLLMHGTKGKDRTGLAAMLVLSALGVEERVMLDDYLLSNEFLAEKIAQDRQSLASAGVGDGDELEWCMAALDKSDERLLRAAFEWMNSTYGSPRGYVTRELGVNQEQLAVLRDKFLE